MLAAPTLSQNRASPEREQQNIWVSGDGVSPSQACISRKQLVWSFILDRLYPTTVRKKVLLDVACLSLLQPVQQSNLSITASGTVGPVSSDRQVQVVHPNASITWILPPSFGVSSASARFMIAVFLSLNIRHRALPDSDFDFEIHSNNR